MILSIRYLGELFKYGYSIIEELFDFSKVILTQDTHYCNLYDGDFEDEDIEELKNFGCKIINDKVIIPSSNTYSISKEKGPGEFNLVHNGIKLLIYCSDEYDETIEIEPTKLGNYVLKILKINYDNSRYLMDAYEETKEYAKVFGVNIE